MGAVFLEHFARAGATCVVNYFNDPGGQNQRDAGETVARLKQLGGAVHLVEADIRDFASVQKLM